MVIALALWFIAYSLENDSRWFPEESQTASEPDWLRPGGETAVGSDAQTESCIQTESDMLTLVEDARQCNTHSDCTLFDYGYPIQCMTSVAKTRITDLRLAYRNYEQQCEFRVYYDCPTGDRVRIPVCEQGMCSVVLSGTDGLTEETLDYLGIDP